MPRYKEIMVHAQVELDWAVTWDGDAPVFELHGTNGAVTLYFNTEFWRWEIGVSGGRVTVAPGPKGDRLTDKHIETVLTAASDQVATMMFSDGVWAQRRHGGQ